jgi:lysophospholipase L1-like esterase
MRINYAGNNHNRQQVTRSFWWLLAINFSFLFLTCSNDTVPRYEQWWLERHNTIISNLKANQKIIFIGDSITQAWETDGYSAWQELNILYNNKISNHGIAGDGIQHVLWRLENGEFPAWLKPEYVVLMIGTNNSLTIDPSIVAEGISLIIQHIKTKSPETQVLLFSLLPSGYTNHTIRNDTINQIIKTDYNYTFIDIFDLYIKEDWLIDNTLFLNDNVHLSLAGYNIWKEAIIKEVTQR